MLKSMGLYICILSFFKYIGRLNYLIECMWALIRTPLALTKDLFDSWYQKFRTEWYELTNFFVKYNQQKNQAILHSKPNNVFYFEIFVVLATSELVNSFHIKNCFLKTP